VKLTNSEGLRALR